MWSCWKTWKNKTGWLTLKKGECQLYTTGYSMWIFVTHHGNHDFHQPVRIIWANYNLAGGFSPTHLKNMLLKMGLSSPIFGVKIETNWVTTVYSNNSWILIFFRAFALLKKSPPFRTDLKVRRTAPAVPGALLHKKTPILFGGEFRTGQVNVYTMVIILPT